MVGLTSNIKLTIGIPVYNGAIYIQQTLDSIISQLDTFDEQNQLEILISDNASDDDTSIVSEKYQANHNDIIRYYRNAENLGYDSNVDLVVERATGKYVWLLGCGDIVKDGAIKHILQHVNINAYDNILLNFDTYSGIKHEIDNERNFIIHKDKTFTSKDEFFVSTKFGITPLSANVVLRASWLRVMDDKPIAPGWIHVKRIMDLMSHTKYGGTLQVSQLCFTLYKESDGWWTKNGNLLLNSINLLKIVSFINKKNTYKKETTDILFNEVHKNLHKLIRWSKRSGLKVNIDLISDTITLFHDKPSYWFFHLPYLLIPNSIFNNKNVRSISNIPRDYLRIIRKFLRFHMVFCI